jgi:hypothetical protein
MIDRKQATLDALDRLGRTACTRIGSTGEERLVFDGAM